MFLQIALCLLALACGRELGPKPEGRACYTDEKYADDLAQNPGLAARMSKFEELTRRYVQGRSQFKRQAVGDVIACVVHVLYNTDEQNIPDDRIIDQIATTNEDFGIRDGNPAWDSVRGDMGYRLKLVAINRVFTETTLFSSNNDMKFTSSGGQDAWDANKYLNIWVCQLGSGLLGYAQFPGGAPETDGVVLLNDCFGGRNVPAPAAPYGNGQTLTHEIGHWVNLRHIWGDGRCRADDFVSDTPISDASNRGCPTGTVSCKTVDMVENYMDYTDDGCMTLFTDGQRIRAEATFEVGGRSSFEFLSSSCSDSNCISCHESAPNTCFECAGGLDLVDGACVSNTVCDDPNCANCIVAATCLECNDGFGLVSGACSACGAGCADCDANVCLTCPTGQYAVGLDCVSCAANCDSCTVSGCDADGCSQSFYNNAGTCTACGAQCNSCSSAGCDANGCNAGFYSNGGVCTACDANCAECDSQGCLVCAPNYESDGQGGCVQGPACSNCYEDCQQQSCCPGLTCFRTRGCGPPKNRCLLPTAQYCNVGCTNPNKAPVTLPNGTDEETEGKGNSGKANVAMVASLAGASFLAGIAVTAFYRRRQVGLLHPVEETQLEAVEA